MRLFSLTPKDINAVSLCEQVRAACATFLKSGDAIGVLMYVLFALMPETPLVDQRLSLSASVPASRLSMGSLFAVKHSFVSQGQCRFRVYVSFSFVFNLK